jgi:hypothetical protein
MSNIGRRRSCFIARAKPTRHLPPPLAWLSPAKLDPRDKDRVPKVPRVPGVPDVPLDTTGTTGTTGTSGTLGTFLPS